MPNTFGEIIVPIFARRTVLSSHARPTKYKSSEVRTTAAIILGLIFFGFVVPGLAQSQQWWEPDDSACSLSGRSPAKEFMDLREVGDDPVIIDVTNDHVQVIAQAKPTWIPWDFFRSEASCNAFVAMAAKARKDANRALQNSLDKYK